MTNEEKAIQLKEKGEFMMRSCWECNPAHAHFKDVSDLFVCFHCGRWYMNGDYFCNPDHCNKEYEHRDNLKFIRLGE